MSNTNIFKSKLAAAENSFNSQFKVITNIQNAAQAANEAAEDEAWKAEVQRDKYQIKMNDMKSKAKFYLKRARKIGAFIDDLDN